MSENTSITELSSQYTAQVTADLERNAKEQERIADEVAALNEQLAALQRDHAVLLSIKQAIHAAPAPADRTETSDESATVPAPRKRAAAAKTSKSAASATSTTSATSAKDAKDAKDAESATTGKATKADKATKSAVGKRPAADKSATKSVSKSRAATAKKTVSGEKPADKAAVSKTEAPKAAQPTLVDLVRRHLGEQSEPRSAAEVTTALGQAHPERNVKTTVIRTTLEGLVAKNQAQRSKQGTSVFYTVADAPGTSASSKSEGAQPVAVDA
ncbi:hypothetical protein [Streptomyces sp. NPDC002328]|uniref:hypothetical protein n=1 Tax=Streptomyces sp. NPDC002328 TaxID=3364642 RepID=UPI00367BC33F